MMYFHLLNLLDTVPEIPKDGILSRTFYKDEQVTALVFGFDTGQELSEHTASRPAILHFLQGEAALNLGGEPQLAQAGTWVYMPPKLAHSVKAQTPLVMLLLMLGEA
jgi:quercetin dioxygenase-like cupin family protein